MENNLPKKTYLKKVHKEYYTMKAHNLYYGSFGQCMGICKSGANKGKRCRNRAKAIPTKWCGKHKPHTPIPPYPVSEPVLV